MKNRSEIKDQFKWDLSPLCKSEEEFYSKLEEAKKYLPKFKKFEGKLNNKETILKYLKLEKEFDHIIEPISLYASLKNDEILSDSKYQIMNEKLGYFLTEFSIETSFADSEINDLSDEMLDDIIKDKDFSDYDVGFKRIKKFKKHKLSKEQEKMLSGMDFLGGFSRNMRSHTDTDLEFGEIKDKNGEEYPLNQSLYGKYVRSGDRELRKNAFVKLHQTFGKSINFFASNYISEIKANCYFSKIRKYKCVLSSALEGEEVTPSVYYNLIKMVKENLPLLFDYFKLKQKELCVKDLYIYDCMASTDVKGDKSYTYDEAIEIIKEAVSPLGEDYVSLIERAKNERWIDVYPNKDKCSGAYQIGIYGYHPYVLTNFEGDLDSVFALAHELGHAMHSYFSNSTQVEEKAQYTVFLAEIASITNEILLINYFLSLAKTDAEKKVLYNKLFDEVKASVFRQTMFSEFEAEMHSRHERGEGLTKDILCEEYYKLNQEYFGKVKLIDEIKYEWARIPHFFTAFYVYKYATGMLTAINFANRILSGEKGAKEDYFKFLKAGGSDTPIKILKRSHCDLENPETINKSFDYLKNILADWKKLK